MNINHKFAHLNQLGQNKRLMDLVYTLKENLWLGAVRAFIKEEVGQMFIESPPFDLHGLWKDSVNTTPIVSLRRARPVVQVKVVIVVITILVRMTLLMLMVRRRRRKMRWELVVMMVNRQVNRCHRIIQVCVCQCWPRSPRRGHARCALELRIAVLANKPWSHCRS